MSEDQGKMTIDDIVEAAFNLFNRLVDRGKKLDGVLLEGLEPDGNGWIVSIGFNGVRKETSEPASTGALAALSGFGSRTTTTVREVRHIHLSDKGVFKKME